MTDPAADPRIADIVKSGRIRLALFLPQYAMTPDGGLNPVGAGVVAHELMGALAGRLGIRLQIVEQPTPHAAIQTLNAGGCDVMILGIEDGRRKVVDFTPPVIRFDFAYLVPAGSPIRDTAEVDRPGVRISVPEGHASWMALERSIRHAEIVAAGLPEEAFALVRDGAVDVFALPREQLIDYAELLPGSRILREGFGVNDVAFAVARGRSQLVDFLGDFTAEARESGRIGRILEDAGLTARGFEVAS